MDETISFDLNALRKIAFCGAYLVAVDFVFEKAEFEALTTFLKKYWQDEFGDRSAFFKSVIDQFKNSMKNVEAGKGEVETFVTGLAEQLDQTQKEIVIGLLNDIAKSDFDVDKTESDFLYFVKQKFGAAK